MFVKRRINSATRAVELWKCEQENREGHAAKNVFLGKIGQEQPLSIQAKEKMTQAPAIFWSYGRAPVNVAVFSPSMLGNFSANAGGNAVLPCDFICAGKFRHGADRWWYRTHQSRWGTKADYESHERSKVMICANREQLMNYVVGPYVLDMNKSAEVGVCGSFLLRTDVFKTGQNEPR